MGIFSFFTSDSEEESEETLETAEQQIRRVEAAPTDELFSGMRLEVMTKEGETLLSGCISECGPDTLTLRRLPGDLAFKTTVIGTTVSISGYDKRLVPVCLSGTVQESKRVVFKVKNLKLEHHSESRESFRLPFSVPVSIYRRDDEQLKHSENCMLVNISTGGCCVQSEYIHMEDEVVRVRIKLEDYAPLLFLGQIVRCIEHASGQFRYGILFAQLTEQEITSLNKTLYNLQMGIRETHKRTDQGHW